MATVHLHLQNVPPEAGALDIRRLFNHFNIPDGGVQIVGGPDGEAFVTFSSYEDLLNATSYDKSYLLGRQLRMNLVNGEEVEKIIDNMKHELAARIRPMEMLRNQHTSQSREQLTSWGMAAAPQDYTPPKDFPWRSDDYQWQKHQLDAASTQVPGYYSSSVYAGGEPKRMRLSSQLPDEGRYYSSTSTLSADRGSEKLQMELELELRRAQEIKDQLNRNKEKIESLKQGIIKEDDFTVPKTNVLAAAQAPQIAGSGADWLRQQSQLQSEQSRYQYQTEAVTVKPEAYQDYSNTSIEETRYQGDGRETYRNVPCQPGFEQPQSASYGNQGDWYNQGVANYPEPTPYYGDQRYSGQNAGYNQGGARYPGANTYGYESYSTHTEGYNHEDPRYSRSSRNYKDQRPSGMNPEYSERMINNKQKEPLAALKIDSGDLSSSHPRYVKMSNVDSTVTSTEVRQFFNGYQISGLKMKKKKRSSTYTAYIKFVQLDDAFYRKNGNISILKGRKVKIETITRSNFDDQDHQEMPTPIQNPVSKMLSQKRATSKVEGAHLQRPKTVSSPYSGSIKQALYFTCMKSLPKDATASSVWQKFGSSSGRSVGVLLLDKKGLAPGREAYVAYENYYDRNSEIPSHEGASDWIDRAVYTRFANASMESKMYKTTPTGEDVELSGDEKAMLKCLMQDSYMSRSKMSLSSHLTEKGRERKQPILNEISRNLFDITSTEVNQQTNIPDLGEYPSETCASGPSYLRLDCLPPDITANEVWDWVGGASGPCLHVTITKPHGKDAPKTKSAYVAFQDRNSCIAEMYKYNQSKSMTEQEASDDMANPGTTVIESTNRVCSQENLKYQVDLKQEPSMRILKIDNAGKELSITKFWKEWFGGKNGPVHGVTAIDAGPKRTAFVVFRDPVQCKAEKVKHLFSEVISETEMLKLLASCSTGKITTSDEKGDRTMSKREHAGLKAKFCTTKEPTNVKDETKVNTSQHTSVKAKDTQKDLKRKHESVGKPSNIKSEEEGKKPNHSSEPKVASTMSKPDEHSDSKNRVEKQANVSEKEAGETSNRTSTGNVASIVSKPEEQMDTEVTVEKQASEDNKPGTVSKPESTDGEDITLPKPKENTDREDTVENQANVSDKRESNTSEHPTKNIATSTSEPEEKTDREQEVEKEANVSYEEKGNKGEHTSEGINPGPVSKLEENTNRKDVTVPKTTEGTQTKFFLQIPGVTKSITACKVWKWFGGPEGSVSRVTLVPKSGSLSGQAYVEFTDRAARDAALSHYQSSKVMTEQEVLCMFAAQACRLSTDIFESSDSGVDRAWTKEERELIKKKVYSVGIPKGNTDKIDTEEKGALTSAKEGGDTPCHALDRKEEHASRDPEPSGDTETVQSTDTKFFLCIPNLSKGVTACRVWSWFGGAKGTLPGVTLVQEAAGMNKNAYVEFKDSAARNAVKLQYKDSADLNEQTMLRTLAEACKSNAGIFQSSVIGKDRVLTLVERDLIKNQVFPDMVKNDIPSENSVPSQLLEETQLISKKAHPEGHLSLGTDRSRQAAVEDVPMYKNLSVKQEAVNMNLPSQSEKPRLLQKSDYEYLHLTELRPEVTAFMLSMQYRPCCGVTLIKNPLGTSVAAYIAFEPKTNPKANVWEKTRDRELAALDLHYEIYEDTGRLGDRLITLRERQEFLEFVKRNTGPSWWKLKQDENR